MFLALKRYGTFIFHETSFILPMQVQPTQAKTAVAWILHLYSIWNFEYSVFCSDQLESETLILRYSQILPPSYSP